MTPLPKKDRKTKHPGVAALKDDRWLVTRTWIDPNTGRRVYRSRLVTGSLDDATKARAELRGQETSARKQHRPRFAAFANTWLVGHKAKLEPSTLDRYTHDVAHLNAQWGDWWVDAITFDACEQWQNEVRSQFSAATINGWHRTLRLVLDRAVLKHVIAMNPARKLSTLHEGRPAGARGTALTAVELRAFVGAIPAAVAAKQISADAARAVHVLSWTGMRIGEVIALRWDDVVEGEFRVERSVWRGHAKATKTDDPRRITVVEPLAAVLEEQRRWLLTSQHPGLASGLVFPSSPRHARAGQARRKAGEVAWYRSQSTLQDAVGLVCVAAGTPTITPHSLRRTFEDLLREAGVEQLVRRAVAGWRSDRAQGIYATVNRADRDAAADAVRKLVLG